MIGLIVKHGDKVYKVGEPGQGVVLASCVVRKEFVLEARGTQGYMAVFRNLREGIEFEVEVAELDEASDPLFENNPAFVEPGYRSEQDLDWKLKQFRQFERILKAEGLLD